MSMALGARTHRTSAVFSNRLRSRSYTTHLHIGDYHTPYVSPIGGRAVYEGMTDMELVRYWSWIDWFVRSLIAFFVVTDVLTG